LVGNDACHGPHLGARGARVVGHGLKHLGGADDGLASQVAQGNHHLLGKEDLLGGDLDTCATLHVMVTFESGASRQHRIYSNRIFAMDMAAFK
jgi:hypothetical protein